MNNRLPFLYIEPNIWQILVLVLITSLVAYASNIAGWNIDPVSFFFIPLILAILFWKDRSFSIITDYLGFNTKNITEKIISSIVGAAAGLSLYFVLKYSKLTLIPYASLPMVEIPKLTITETFTSMFPIIFLFSIVITVSMILASEKIKPTYLIPIVLSLAVPFLFTTLTPSTVLYFIVGYGEEILCLIFAMIAINWLVSKFNMKYENATTHILGWMISRASWSVIHALSTYGFIIGAYTSAFLLGMIFTLIGYMFWYSTVAFLVMMLLGVADIIIFLNHGIAVALYAGVLLITVATILLIDKNLFRDDSLKFKEYVIYGAAMAHAFYNLAFVLFP